MDSIKANTPLGVLEEVFGYRSFIGLQQAVIERVWGGGDAVVLMPTGGGKSLCYQIPAMLRPGMGVVVSPLIALMRDQVRALVQYGVRAGYWNSSLSAARAAGVRERMRAGEFDVMYVSPERLCREDFLAFLQSLDVNLFAIDEAHCVSQWGHDFRPEYMRLDVIRERFPGVPRLALTATADTSTRADILDKLGFAEADVFATGFDRPNLRYDIRPKDRSGDQLLDFIREKCPGQSGIVYCMTRKRTEATAEKLRKHGIPSLAYHAGMTAQERDEAQERFMRETGIVMAATIAFGMGVDKPDVRFVAHLDPPASLEAYHQETGRAGRDGDPALAFCLYGMSDIVGRRRLIDSGGADEARKRLEHAKLNALVGYLETAECRRKVLLGYFGEKVDNCGNCDNCLNPPETRDGTVAAQKALSNIYRTGQRFGVKHLIDVLLGRETDKILRLGHDSLSTFGIGGELDEDAWRSLHRQLVSAGLADVHMRHFGLSLTPEAWPLLRGERKISFRIEPKRVRKRANAGSRKVEVQALRGEARELQEALWRERRELAEEHGGVPAYAIFPDKTLLEMIAYRPRDEREMVAISGVGAVKLERFGARFLGVLKRHEDEHGRPEDLPELEPEPEPPAPAERPDAPDRGLEGEALELQQALWSVRRETAGEQGIPPYAVFPDRTLMEMIARRPRDEEELKALKGVGPVKLERFGGVFLGVLKRHEDEHGRPENLPEPPPEAPKKRKPRPKAREDDGNLTPTEAETLRQFRLFGSREEVARERGLSMETIIKHLTAAVGDGRAEIDEISGLTPEQRRCVAETAAAFKAEGFESMKPVFDALNGQVPYAEIRLARLEARGKD